MGTTQTTTKTIEIDPPPRVICDTTLQRIFNGSCRAVFGCDFIEYCQRPMCKGWFILENTARLVVPSFILDCQRRIRDTGVIVIEPLYEFNFTVVHKENKYRAYTLCEDDAYEILVQFFKYTQILERLKHESPPLDYYSQWWSRE